MPLHAQRRTTHLIKHVLQALPRQRRAFHVLHCSQFPSEPLALNGSDGPLFLPHELLQHLTVVPEINLGADNNARDTRAVMAHFREPLLLYVFERGRGRYTEADKEHVCLGV